MKYSHYTIKVISMNPKNHLAKRNILPSLCLNQYFNLSQYRNGNLYGVTSATPARGEKQETLMDLWYSTYY